MKRIGWIAFVAVLLCVACAGAEGILFTLPVRGASVEVFSTEIEGENWLFLPAFADVNSLKVHWQDEAPDAEGVRRAEVDGETLYVMQSQNLRALFLFSDDPVNEGRDYLENSERHSARTTGYMAIISPDGTVDHADELRQLRGRGNSTWGNAKKPYQFKLESRADLLRTGDRSERNRTWVLLADAYDATFLHNRIALDMGLEMGLHETPHNEHVDLYYDGEYRGLYLLTEKVEVGDGRVEIDDYDHMIKEMNKKAGIMDAEQLDAVQDIWRTGMYSYIDGLVGPEDPSVGTYLLEMEGEGTTQSNRCWFHLSDNSLIALKSPTNATENMVLYVNRRLEEGRQTLLNGGVNPENGRTAEDDFDLEAFARILAIEEFFHSADHYTYSSSWFILPAGEDRFVPGPLWDFDLSMRRYREGLNENGIGQHAMKDWPELFYNSDAFVEHMRRIYLEEISPLVENILLGTQEGRYLKSLEAYTQEINAARMMNEKCWEPNPYFEFCFYENFEAEIEFLRTFLTQRHEWLKQAMQDASPYTPDTITLWGNAEYGQVDSILHVYACSWNNVEVADCTWEMISEATEEDYAVYELEVILAPKPGYTFENPSVTFGGKPIRHEALEDGTIRIRVSFEDPSYRPVDYYGEDIGLIYNPEIYAQNYPEIAAEYEDDPEGLMDYFCDEGMYEDHKGNAFFRPSEILVQNANLIDVLGEDWQLYYWDFLYYGHADGWLVRGISPGFGLDVTDVL